MSRPAEAFLLEAIRLGREGMRTGKGGPFGAVVVQAGQIVAGAANQVLAACDPTAHAEVLAIREASRILGRFKLTGCDLYASSEPCPMCLGAIYWAGIERLWFSAGREDASRAGFADAYLYQEMSREPERRSLRTVQVQLAEGREVFEEWRRKPDKVPY